MTNRSRDKGTAFETLITNYLSAQLDNNGERTIERRAGRGAKDRGDVTGLYIRGHRLVAELKNCARVELPKWVDEAHIEAGNDDALVGIVIAKRRGVRDPGKQWVHMEVRDLIALITGQKYTE